MSEKADASQPSTTDLHLDFSGTAAIVLGLVGYGPMVVRVDDVALVKQIIKVVLDATDDRGITVDSYDTHEQGQLEQLLVD